MASINGVDMRNINFYTENDNKFVTGDIYTDGAYIGNFVRTSEKDFKFSFKDERLYPQASEFFASLDDDSAQTIPVHEVISRFLSSLFLLTSIERNYINYVNKGFPHVFVVTDGSKDVGIGIKEAMSISTAKEKFRKQIEIMKKKLSPVVKPVYYMLDGPRDFCLTLNKQNPAPAFLQKKKVNIKMMS